MIIILCIVPWTTCMLAYLSQLHIYLRNCLHLRYTNFLTLYCKFSICIIKNLPFTRCHAFYVIYQYVHLKYTNLRSFDLDATFKCPLHQCLKKSIMRSYHMYVLYYIKPQLRGCCFSNNRAHTRVRSWIIHDHHIISCTL